MEWMCETEECLVDQNLLDNLVQSQNYLDWIPGNYSQFWGKTLQEGQNGRLGTDSTLVRKISRVLKLLQKWMPRFLANSFFALNSVLNKQNILFFAQIN